MRQDRVLLISRGNTQCSALCSASVSSPKGVVFPAGGELLPGCPCSAQPHSHCSAAGAAPEHPCTAARGDQPLSTPWTLEKGQGCLPSAALRSGSIDCRWKPLFLSRARFLLLFKQICCERDHQGNTPPSDGI